MSESPSPNFTTRYNGVCRGCNKNIQKYLGGSAREDNSGQPVRVRCSECDTITSITATDK